MAINRVDITVQNLAALSLVWVSELEDGALAWVIADNSYYVLVKNSGAAPIGTTIISPAPGSPIAGNAGARWFFLEFGPDEASSQQPVWFIDPLNGSDENDGLTALTAIKTEQEAVQRIGTSIINVPMVWNLMNDFPLDNPFYVPPTMQIGSAGSLTIKGIKPLVTLASGTLTGAVAITRGAGGGSPQTITDAAQNWTAVGAINTPLGAMVRVRLTANGAIAYGFKETPLGTLSTSPFNIPISSIGVGQTQYTPVGNEAYVVETGFVQIADFRVTPSGNSNGGALFSEKLFCFEIALPNADTQAGLIAFIQATPQNGPTEVLLSACDTGRLQPYSCIVSEGACKQSGNFRVLVEGTLSCRGNLCTQSILYQGSNTGSNLFGDQTFALGGRLNILGTGVQIERVGIFDNPVGGNPDGISIFPGGSVKCAPFLNTEALYGNGNVRGGINAQGGGKLWYATVKPTVTGLVTDVRMNGVNLGAAGTGYAKIPFYDVRNDFYRGGLIGTTAGAATRFLLFNGTEAAVDPGSYLVGEPCVVRNLRVFAAVPPGGAVTDTYTVFKNGVAQTVLTPLGPAVTSNSDLTNSFTAVAGDRLSMQVSSAGGVSVTANTLFEVEVLATNSPGEAIVQGG